MTRQVQRNKILKRNSNKDLVLKIVTTLHNYVDNVVSLKYSTLRIFLVFKHLNTFKFPLSHTLAVPRNKIIVTRNYIR